MIKELNIKNFAIIDSLKVDFEDGFNVISGETGAGKTLIIKAIDILLGGKINKKMIRDSQKDLEISGKFIYRNELLEISRIYRKDRSYSLLNKKRISSNEVLNKYSSIVQFQRQHDSNYLLDNTKHILMLDSYIGNEKELNVLKNLFRRYLEDMKSYDDLVANATSYQNKMDLNKYQMNELNSVKLESSEEAMINKKYKQYMISKEIIDAINTYTDLNDNFQLSPISNIEKSIKSFLKFSSEDNDINSIVIRLEEALLELKDVNDEVSSLSSKYHFNNDDIAILEEKVMQYEQIKRKYGGSIQSAIKYRDSLLLEFDGSFSYDDRIKDLKNKLILSKKLFLDKAKEISIARKDFALTMENKINSYLSKVDMPNSKIKILINPADNYKENGVDECCIYIITNKGEKYKPLQEIASGGEISRIMLSISLVLSNVNTGSTLVFDEVDTGVSGATASNMGNLLKDLSGRKQLIVVTHLPQIASKANSHLYAYKSIVGSKTLAQLKYLKDKDRQNEIARMLSGKEITQHSLKQAERFILDG